MPGTTDEFIALVDGLITARIAPDQLDDLRWADETPPTHDELRGLLGMYAYEVRRRRRYKPVAQRKAMKLLRSLLSAEQKRSLRAGRYFYVTTKSGATFRFLPRSGFTERVERHGKHWFMKSHFCLHDAESSDQMPPADIVVAHLLLINADEGKFLAMANEHASQSQLWDGEYMRRMRRHRMERQNAG
jgi:hypothetical protein